MKEKEGRRREEKAGTGRRRNEKGEKGRRRKENFQLVGQFPLASG